MTSPTPDNADRCWVIAEAGVNHGGSVERALQMIDAAAQAGADAVKFQTFSARRLVSVHAAKAPYQAEATGDEQSQLDMLRALELDHAAHRRLRTRCDERGVEFLSTPFEQDSLRFLVDELGARRLKLGSGELTNAPLLVAAGRTGRPILLSTGMATENEVQAALGAIAWGAVAGTSPEAPAEVPSEGAFEQAFASSAGQELLRRDVTLLHCTTAYPTPIRQANLRAITTLRERFGLPVGFSDHTPGTNLALAAVALGARVIEKHFTLDRSLPGPDQAASLTVEELAELVRGVHMVSEALGDGIKAPQPSEAANTPVARKSLVALRPIRAGEPLTPDNLGAKRPGTGRSPFDYWLLLGTPSERDYAEDELID